MIANYKNVEMLLKSEEVSNYKISKDTGIAQSTLSDYSSGKSKIGNMKFEHAIILSNYWEELDMITIEKRKNHEGIIGTEYTETYNDLEQAKIRLNEVIADALEGTDFDDLDEFEQDEYKQLEGLINGEYSLNQGDYTYYITITKGVKNVQEQIKQAIDYGLSIDWVKAVTGQDAVDEAIEELTNMYVDTNLTIEQFVFEKLQEDGRVKDEDAFDDEAEANAEGYYWYDEVSKWIDVE